MHLRGTVQTASLPLIWPVTRGAFTNQYLATLAESQKPLHEMSESLKEREGDYETVALSLALCLSQAGQTCELVRVDCRKSRMGKRIV